MIKDYTNEYQKVFYVCVFFEKKSHGPSIVAISAQFNNIRMML